MRMKPLAQALIRILDLGCLPPKPTRRLVEALYHLRKSIPDYPLRARFCLRCGAKVTLVRNKYVRSGCCGRYIELNQ